MAKSRRGQNMVFFQLKFGDWFHDRIIPEQHCMVVEETNLKETGRAIIIKGPQRGKYRTIDRNANVVFLSSPPKN